MPSPAARARPDRPVTPVHRPAAAGSIGALLAQRRAERGWSQLRLAEQLCAAAGVATVSRHEISRWERERRVPGAFWLAWLAAVLDAPVEVLVAACPARRPRRPGPPGRAGLRERGRVGAASVGA